jgi:hypothetical protein
MRKRPLTKGPIRLGVVVQLAGDGDDVTDSSVPWPDIRPEIKFGTITLTERADDMEPERRKIIFDPIPRIDGIDTSGDPLSEVVPNAERQHLHASRSILPNNIGDIMKPIRALIQFLVITAASLGIAGQAGTLPGKAEIHRPAAGEYQHLWLTFDGSEPTSLFVGLRQGKSTVAWFVGGTVPGVYEPGDK